MTRDSLSLSLPVTQVVGVAFPEGFQVVGEENQASLDHLWERWREGVSGKEDRRERTRERRKEEGEGEEGEKVRVRGKRREGEKSNKGSRPRQAHRQNFRSEGEKTRTHVMLDSPQILVRGSFPLPFRSTHLQP